MTKTNWGSGAGNSELESFFSDSLKSMYRDEKYLLEILPGMQKAAITAELKLIMDAYIGQAQVNIGRLERLLKMHSNEVPAKGAAAIEGVIEKGDPCIEATEDTSMTKDTAIIIAAQKIVHYEIATYSGLVFIAKTLGLPEVVITLAQTMDEEKKMDMELMEVAEESIDWTGESGSAVMINDQKV